MRDQIDIEQAIKLVNKRTTTVDQLCRFISSDIENYKESREAYYLEQFKQEFSDGIHKKDLDKIADEQADKIHQKIQKDSKSFVATYTEKSIDLVLDAKNEKKFKTKKGFEAILVLLSTLKEMNEEENV